MEVLLRSGLLLMIEFLPQIRKRELSQEIERKMRTLLKSGAPNQLFFYSDPFISRVLKRGFFRMAQGR